MTTTTDTERMGERLAHLEGAYAHLATKADIERAISSMVKWLVGMAIALFIPIYGVLITILVLLLSD